MGASLVNDAAGVGLLVQEFWSNLFMPELMEVTMLAKLVNKDYDGEIKQLGDTVKVSQIVRPTATTKTVGVDDHMTFNSEKLQALQVSVVADTVVTASFDFDNLSQLQSQIGSKDSDIRKGLLEAMDIALNNFCYGKVAPSTSAPDHDLGSVTDFNAAQLLIVRKLAAQAKWLKAKGWWLLADPSFYNDLLGASTLTSADYATDMPSINGEFATKRNGFYILEDNSDGLIANVSAGTEDAALAFSPDFLHLVMPKAPTFEVSSLHPLGQHGFKISCSMVCGAKLGIGGNEKHIIIR